MGSSEGWNRREALRVLSGTALAWATNRLGVAKTEVGAASSASAVGGLTPYSVLTPELTEGPFYISRERIRRDITEGKPGVPLRLRIQVAHVTSGAPIPKAAVDVWHCDAQGIYSGFSSHQAPGQGRHVPPPPGPRPLALAGGGNLPPPPPGSFGPGGPERPGFGPPHFHRLDNNLNFLRGVQLTDADGLAEIETIFPGWYMGRATHIHVRVHTGGLASDGRYKMGHISHTGQIFFPEAITCKVYELAAYAKKDAGRMSLREDGIFRQGGSRVADLTPLVPGETQPGFVCATLLVIDPTTEPIRT